MLLQSLKTVKLHETYWQRSMQIANAYFDLTANIITYRYYLVLPEVYVNGTV